MTNTLTASKLTWHNDMSKSWIFMIITMSMPKSVPLTHLVTCHWHRQFMVIMNISWKCHDIGPWPFFMINLSWNSWYYHGNIMIMSWHWTMTLFHVNLTWQCHCQCWHRHVTCHELPSFESFLTCRCQVTRRYQWHVTCRITLTRPFLNSFTTCSGCDPTEMAILSQNIHSEQFPHDTLRCAMLEKVSMVVRHVSRALQWQDFEINDAPRGNLLTQGQFLGSFWACQWHVTALRRSSFDDFPYDKMSYNWHRDMSHVDVEVTCRCQNHLALVTFWHRHVPWHRHATCQKWPKQGDSDMWHVDVKWHHGHDMSHVDVKESPCCGHFWTCRCQWHVTCRWPKVATVRWFWQWHDDNIMIIMIMMTSSCVMMSPDIDM